MLKILRKPGDRHGRLVIVRELAPNKWDGRRFTFRCDCGNFTDTSWGTSISCGCVQREKRQRLRKAGDRHGKLVLVREAGRDAWNARQFLFNCDCGKQVTVKWGSTISCGCAQREALHRITNYRKRLPSGEACANTVYLRYMHGARRRQLAFELDKPGLLALTQKPCYYCGVLPQTVERKQGDSYSTFTYNGIDRVDNTKGYTFDNVVTCCRTCNTAKRTQTKNEFLSWIEKVYENTRVLRSAG